MNGDLRGRRGADILGSLARLSRIALLAPLLVASTGCVRDIADHCDNLSKHATCEARDMAFPICSPCTAENDGCVAPGDPSLVGCAALGETATSVADGGTATSTADGGMTSMVTVSTDGGTMPVDDTTAESTGGPFCGDGMVNNDEEVCDGSDLDGFDCTDFGVMNPAGLACSENCMFDINGCEAIDGCGDGVVQPPEQCDGDDFAGATCQSETGFSDGMLQCSGCVINTTDCCKPLGEMCDDDVQCCSNNCEGLAATPLLKTCME